MAEFLTMEEAEDKFGKKGTARAGLTLGIIGTALAALGNNKGDIITISNTGASALTITGVTSPEYNVSIVIERFN